MSVTNKKGPIIDPGVCRCCGSTKKCRLLNVEYEWIGQKEVYSDMFFDTFGLLLSHLDGEPEERLICATCVSRLRDAGAFRRQALNCEERLLQSKMQQPTDLEINVEIKVETDLREETKAIADMLPNDDDHVDDDLDHVSNESDSNMSSLKAEPLIKNTKKSVKKEKKSPKKCKRKAGRAVRETPKDVLMRIKMMEAKLEQMEQVDHMPEKPLRLTRQRIIDNETKAFRNTVTIVENSYVCPFDTSFSDYYCLYCRQVYTDPNKLREHTMTHDPTTFKDSIASKKMPQIDITRIDCRICPERIDNIDILKNHLTVIHGKDMYEARNEFLKFHLTATNLTCTECNSSFSFFHALKKHMAEHFGTCICDVCGAHYFEERMLLLHQKTHQRIEENFPCKDCGKIFKSKHSRYLHESKTHKKEPAYQCPKCDEVLFTYSLRYRHMIDVHGEERMFQCEHCDRAYDSRKSLREHNRRFHLKIFKHQCDLCDKRFYLPSRLKEHMATHTGERNFRCEYCGKSYPRLRGLKVHMQSHSSEKKYRCLACNAAFTQNVNLKNHVKRQHLNVEVEDGYHE